MASFTAKLGAFDFSQYVRVGPGEGMDPYGSGWEEPIFQDVAVAEGQPLLGTDIKNSEKVWPLYLNAADKDTLHNLIRDLQREIRYGASPQRLEWKDRGASNSTFYDVEQARFDPSFSFRQSEHGWFAGNLRVWCQPPYGHTATQRLVSSAVGTSGALLATVGALAGDVMAQAEYRVTTSGEPVGPAGRIVGAAVLPTSSYRPFYPAASLTVVSAATLMGASGAPGSQVLGLLNPNAATSLRYGNVVRLPLDAAAYPGNHRVLAAVRPGRRTGMAMWAFGQDDRQIGPTAMSETVYRDGMQLLDLGVARVGSGVATYLLNVGWGQVSIKANDGNTNLQIPAQPAGCLAGLYILPEDQTVLIADRLAEPIAEINGYSAASVVVTTDDRSTMALQGGFAKTASGMVAIGGFGILTNNSGRAVTNFRARLAFAAATVNGGLIYSGKYNSDDGSWVLALVSLNAAKPAVSLQVGLTPLVSQATYLLPLQATSLLTAASTMWHVEAHQIDDAAWVTMRLTNATGVGIYTGGTWGIGATTVPVACVGVSTSMLRGIRGGSFLDVVDDITAKMTVEHFDFSALTGRATPSDMYLFDGVNDTMSVTHPTYGVEDRTGAGRGPIPRIVPSGKIVAAFDAQIDGGPMNDPMAVTVAVRERFTFAR